MYSEEGDVVVLYKVNTTSRIKLARSVSDPAEVRTELLIPKSMQ